MTVGMRRAHTIRLGLALLLAAAGAGAAAEDGRSALFFLLQPSAAKPGEVVTVRTGGTPASFTLGRRVRPFGRSMRLYLVPNRLARDVHSRFDRRAHFIGRLVPDARGRGMLRFTVPPLDSDRFTIAAWCPGCAAYSRGRTWSVIEVNHDIVPRYRSQMLLRIGSQPATPCPVTTSATGRLGNGALSTPLLPRGTLAVDADDVAPGGSIGWKFGWRPSGIPSVPKLTVAGLRLDAASPPMRVFSVNWGYSYTAAGQGPGSWATAVSFPTPGCWKLTGRAGDITLSFVIRVAIE
jgi:hypothetical protein